VRILWRGARDAACARALVWVACAVRLRVRLVPRRCGTRPRDAPLSVCVCVCVSAARRAAAMARNSHGAPCCRSRAACWPPRSAAHRPGRSCDARRHAAVAPWRAGFRLRVSAADVALAASLVCRQPAAVVPAARLPAAPPRAHCLPPGGPGKRSAMSARTFPAAPGRRRPTCPTPPGGPAPARSGSCGCAHAAGGLRGRGARRAARVWRGAARRGAARRGVAWRGVARRGVAWRGVAWRGEAWRGVAWRGVRRLSHYCAGMGECAQCESLPAVQLCACLGSRGSTHA
jgi:hypothetical protein